MKRFSITSSKENIARERERNHLMSDMVNNLPPILTTTKSLSIIPQLDLAYNKKKLAEWRDKERLEK